MSLARQRHTPSRRSNDKLSLKVWLQLMKCSKAIEAEVAGRLRKDYNQSLSRFDVLSQLYRLGGGWMSVGEIARRVMASSGNITALLDRMKIELLIERRPSPDDRRSYQIAMTAKGAELFEEMAAAHADWVERALHGVPDRDKKRLIELLVEVRSAFEPTESRKAQ